MSFGIWCLHYKSVPNYTCKQWSRLKNNEERFRLEKKNSTNLEVEFGVLPTYALGHLPINESHNLLDRKPGTRTAKID